MVEVGFSRGPDIGPATAVLHPGVLETGIAFSGKYSFADTVTCAAEPSRAFPPSTAFLCWRPSRGGTEMHVLVGYASWQGSTAEIARRIATTLEGSGIAVKAAPVGDVKDLTDYDAVVLGSAMHNQAWMKEAADFIHCNATALSRRPVWLFSVGMTAGLPRPLRRMARTAQEQRVAAALRDDVHPREHRVFSGVCRPEQLPPWAGVAFRALGGHFGDYRDWPEIEAWARQIAQHLRARPALGES